MSRFLAALVLVVVTWPQRADAQGAWEYSPYRVQVWLSLGEAPQLPAELLPTFVESVQSRAQAVFGAVWQVEVREAPLELRGELARGLDRLSLDSIQNLAAAKVLEGDKLYIVRATFDDGTIRIAARELDCRTRQWSEVNERICPAAGLLPQIAWQALAESFTPLAQIEQVEGKKITARLRAGGLIVDPASPALVEPSMSLRPVIRRNDRAGQLAKDGIQALAWTILSVEDRQDSLLECTLYSGYRTAIPARGGSRLERLALLVRPHYATTRLMLRSRTNADKPLVNYEIHRRVSEDDTELLGVTDATGSLDVPRGDGSLQTLLVKNGKQLLARLPIVPGQEESLVAKVVDDDARLTAEGLITALQSRALDLVARREILANRIRSRIKEGKVSEAQQLLDQFRRVETRVDLNRDLDLYRQQATTSDKLTQTRIDRLFTDAQKMLTLKPLSDDVFAQLNREVAAASTRASGGGQ